MQQIDLDEAKSQMARLIQSALDGEEVILTENDQPVLKIVRVEKADAPAVLYRREQPAPKPYRQSGSAKGLISMSGDFDDPLEDFAEYMQ
jgi:antitoxin (DNA-binding transcriptional repressor) of toxin-antitoxin stability system